MLGFGIKEGFVFGGIITKTSIRELIRQADYIRFIRSGVNAYIEHCADVIEEECKAALRPKHICIVLPSILNRDLVVRAREAERDPEEVLANMADWQEQLARLQQRLEPRHKLEVRTTLEPHRYHAIFSESEAIFGLPWHSEATLNTSSFFVRCDTTGLLAMLHKDFEVFFRKCTPYQIGDNARLRKENAARTIDEEVLHTFGRRLPQVLRILEYIVSYFPQVGGGGATKNHIRDRFKLHESDANKRLLDMERAGLLMRAGENCCKKKGDKKDDHDVEEKCHGRLATLWGKSMAKKYKDYPFDTAE